MSSIFFSIAIYIHTHRRRISISHPNDPSSSLSTDHPDHHGDATTRSSKYNTIISEDSQVHIMPVAFTCLSIAYICPSVFFFFFFCYANNFLLSTGHHDYNG